MDLLSLIPIFESGGDKLKGAAFQALSNGQGQEWLVVVPGEEIHSETGAKPKAHSKVGEVEVITGHLGSSHRWKGL